MAFRFQRRVRILPGVRLNFGKTGVSVSAGVRGASVTAGRRGIYGNVGAPGTGMSYRTRLDKSKAHQRRASHAQHQQKARLQGAGHVQLTCDERGKLNMLEPDGSPATSAVVKHVWENHSDQVRQFLAKEMEKINDDQELLVNIHLDTPDHQTSSPEHERTPYVHEAPRYPHLPDLPKQPQAREKSWWHKLFRKLDERRVAANQADETRWQEETNRIKYERQQLEQEHASALAAWQIEKTNHDQEQQKLATEFAHRLQQDTDFMSDLLEQELDQLDWPRETNVDFEIVSDTLKLDVDLPTAEIFPSREASLNQAGRRLLIKDKSATQQRKEYAQYVHGVVFRVIGVAFVTLPAIQHIKVGAYTQGVNDATGHDADQYLLSVTVTREQWQTLNLSEPERIDPVSALTLFNLRRNMTKTGIFRPIEM